MSAKGNAGPETLPQRLLFLLRAKQMSQYMLAEEIQTNQANVSRWLSGSVPELGMAAALAKRLNVTLEWLLYGVGNGPSALDAFQDEIRNNRVPQIESTIKQIEGGPDPRSSEQATYLEHLKSIKQSLIRISAHAEKEGEVVALLPLPKVKLRSDPLDTSTKQSMLASVLGLPPGASDRSIEEAYRKHMTEKFGLFGLPSNASRDEIHEAYRRYRSAKVKSAASKLAKLSADKVVTRKK